jgi:hypothetical protein
VMDTKSIKSQSYQIRVEGHLDDSRAGGLEDMTINLLPDGQTLISGRVKDQAELFGILIRIRDMGIPLISVNRIEILNSHSSHSIRKELV